MYRVMVVDDERVIRKWLITKIPWEELGFKIIGECEDGEKACEMVMDQNPDLIVTDVKMPVMDGIEFIKKLRKDDNRSKIIIISGFEEFAYAKAAICNGVSDYILKPIESGEFINTLKKMKQSFDEDARLKEEYSYSRMSFEEGKKYQVIEFLKSLINGEILVNLVPQMDKLDILNGERYFCFINVLFDTLFTDDVNKTGNDLIESIKEIIKTTFQNIECQIVIGRDSILAFLTSVSVIEKPALVRYAQNGKNVIERLLEPINTTVTIGIGDIHSDRMQIIDAYNEANIVKERRFYDGKNQIYSCSSCSNEYNDERIILPDAEKDIVTSFTSGNLNKVEEVLFTIYNYINEQHTFKKDAVTDFFEHIVDLLIEKISRLDNINREKLNRVCMIRNNLSNGITLSDVRDMSISAVNNLEDIMHEIRNDGKINIGSVINYIEKNIVNKELTLNEVAGFAHLSPKHFSVVFKQEMGVNFIDYITGVKIQKTKELLEQTDKKINDISKMLGFNDFKYFGRLFKKETGLTPTQFRRRIK